VEVVVSGRAHGYLKEHFGGVHEIWGLSIVMEDHEVKRWDTAMSLLRGAASGWPENLKRYAKMTDAFKPDAVVSDFESFSAYYGHSKGLPVICLDNIQAVRRVWHAPEILRGKKIDWRLTKGIIKAKIPTADHYLITTFFDAPLKHDNTTLVPPILRRSILEAQPTQGDHVLVYQTGETFKNLPEVLRRFPEIPFHIYGLRRDLKEPVVEGNLTFCPFGEQSFVDDLASSRGVIASAGFTLIGEALHLGKPYLATPVKGQFEQVMNARYIEHLGYGLQDEALDEFSVRAFLNQLDTFAQNLHGYPRHDNEVMFSALEEHLDRAAAGL
jgi:uncharacterized protein (TIGR00661 family)